MPLRHDEIKEVQEITMMAIKTASNVVYESIMEKLNALERRITAIEKQSIAPTKQGKEKTNA